MMPPRPLSLSYYTVPELDALECVSVAAGAGFRFVGLRLLGGAPGGSEMPLMTDAGLRRRMRDTLREHGVEALDANTIRLVADSHPADFLPMLDVAAELGARHVLTTCDDADNARRVERLALLAGHAGERGLTLDIEFVPWQATRDLAAAAALVREVDHPALGIAVDALHLYRSGSDPALLAELPGAWFRYLQLCDAPARAAAPTREELVEEAVRERLAPGDGDIDLAAILAALPTDLPIALEVPQAMLARRVAAPERVARLGRAMRALLSNGQAGHA